jgi:hypothetical protein
MAASSCETRNRTRVDVVAAGNVAERIAPVAAAKEDTVPAIGSNVIGGAWKAAVGPRARPPYCGRVQPRCF